MSSQQEAQPRSEASLRAPRSSRSIASGALFTCVCAFLAIFLSVQAALALAFSSAVLAGASLLRIRAGKLSDDGKQLAVVALYLGCILGMVGLVQSVVLLPLNIELWGPLQAIRQSTIHGTPAP